MYAAPSTMPLAATAAHILFAVNTPCKISSSPMNPLSAGNPIDDIVIRRNTAAYPGMTFESPPYSEISRVCRRSYTTPTSRKSAPVEMPWLICWMMLPVMPTGLSANIPSITRAMWLTEEYATSRFQSFWAIATSAP